MAKVIFRGMKEYGDALRLLEVTWAGNRAILEKAARAGANPVADEIRNRLANLPEEKFHRLPDGEKMAVVSAHQKKDLLDSLGVTKPRLFGKSFVNVKVGFAGYGSFPTETYPNGVPNALIARAVESGSSVRQKTPFVLPAVNATRQLAVAEMEKIIVGDIKKIFEEL